MQGTIFFLVDNLKNSIYGTLRICDYVTLLMLETCYNNWRVEINAQLHVIIKITKIIQRKQEVNYIM